MIENPNGQPRMDNPETLSTLDTQDHNKQNKVTVVVVIVWYIVGFTTTCTISAYHH